MELCELFNEIEQAENEFCSFVEKYKSAGKYVFLFGAGLSGERYKALLEREHFPVAGVVDNFKDSLQGVPVMRLEEVLCRYSLEDCVFLIAAPRAQKEIHRQLADFVKPEQIYQFAAGRNLSPGCDPVTTKKYYLSQKAAITNLYGILADDWSKRVLINMIIGQVKGSFCCFEEIRTDDFYYPPDIIRFCDKEVMVELGSNNGETLLDFIARCPNFQKAYCFEPDKYSIAELGKAMQAYRDRVTIIPKIAWNERTRIGFSSDGGNGASMVQLNINNPHILLQTTTVDLEVREKITYMKMDVEGAEMMALQGAKNQIIQNKPKLAVSLYHKKEDVVDIPRYIHSLRPDYRFYMRHHGWDESDTVLYAV